MNHSHDHHEHQAGGADPVASRRSDQHAEHGKHAGHSVAMFKRKFWVALVLTIPTLIWGHMLPAAFGYTPPAVPGGHFFPPIFGTAVFLVGGWPFLQGAWRELKERLPGMMTLISLAISVAFGFSVAVTLGYPGTPLWEELATLVTIMLLGHWLEMRSINQASGAVQELAKLLPDMAVRIEGDQLVEVPVSALREGDIVLVRPGQGVPADGVVRDGQSTVNEAMITGESQPVTKRPDDKVIAGTINGAGALRISVTGTGERTALARIMRLVEQAQTSRSRAQVLADRAAYWLTIVALGAGAVTLVTWLALGAESAFAIERLVGVLVIACPHALGLAVPLVVAISTTLGARSGLLVRDRRGLEEARNLNVVIFDKTGTLTRGEFGVTEVGATNGETQESVLRLAASVEHDSQHPLAQGIVRAAQERGITAPAAEGLQTIMGKGITARAEGRELFIGGPALMAHLGLTPPRDLTPVAERAAAAGRAALYLCEKDRVLGVLVVADVVRPESHEAIKSLHSEGIEVAMLTGDAWPVAKAVAAELGIDRVLAQVLPEHKSREVEQLQQAGKRVAMVGDGVNDAPALVTADVGIAIGAGTDVPVEAGDVVLVRSDPRDVPKIITLSRVTYRKMIQNLWWAAGYNIVAIPLAAGVLAPWGVILSPAVGAILMSGSTIVVAINAQLLRREMK